MVDIVERLRDNLWAGEPFDNLMAEAANHIESLMHPSWDHLMAILDEIYPPHIFDESSGGEGPRTLALIREIERLRTLITAWADNRDERDGFPWGLEPREAKERDDARWARSKEIESALLEAVGR